MQAADVGVALRPLTLVDEGADVLVGDPESGTYVAIPAVGAIVIRALQRGATIAEAAEEAERAVGEPVDVPAFVAALGELGFVDGEHAPEPTRTAVVQQRRWLRGPAPERVRPFFGRAAWTVYGAAFVFSVVCFAMRPDLFPRAHDIFVAGDYGWSLFIMLPLSAVQVSVHEAWHWLAARAEGLSIRFGLDRRFFFPVFETDLTQLWSLPRRRRYGPQLAGIALDIIVLAVLLVIELAAGHRIGGIGGGLVRGLVFLQVTQFLWQLMIFLRTDTYAVFVTATGCRNLWEVKSLLLRRAFGRLSAAERDELAGADPRDLRIGHWFRWIYLGGMVLAAGYFAFFFLPGIWAVLTWTAHELAGGPWHGGFWRSIAATVFACFSPVFAASVAIVSALRRRR